MGRKEKLVQQSIKVFKFNNGNIIEYSLSEIGYIFKDDLDGFGIFNIRDYNGIYDDLKLIQKEIQGL